MDKLPQVSDVTLHLDLPVTDASTGGGRWHGRIMQMRTFLQNHGLELLIGVVVSVAMWMFSIPFGFTLIGFALGLFTTRLALKLVDEYDYLPARKIMKQIERVDQKFPQTRVVSLLISVIVSYQLPKTAIGFGVVAGSLTALSQRQQQMDQRLETAHVSHV